MKNIEYVQKSFEENENKIKSNDMSIYTITVCVEIQEVSKHYE